MKMTADILAPGELDEELDEVELRPAPMKRQPRERKSTTPRLAEEWRDADADPQAGFACTAAMTDWPRSHQ